MGFTGILVDEAEGGMGMGHVEAGSSWRRSGVT
jgi:hypothetical protein